MRHFIALALVLAAAPAVAQTPAAAPAAAPVAAAATSATYSSTGTPIGTLLDNAAAKAILDKRVPGLTTNPQIEMARGMSLKDIQAYAPQQLTDDVLKAVDADLAALSGK